MEILTILQQFKLHSNKRKIPSQNLNLHFREKIIKNMQSWKPQLVPYHATQISVKMRRLVTVNVVGLNGL